MAAAVAVVDYHSPCHPFPDGHLPVAFQDIVDNDAPPPIGVVLVEVEVVDDDDDSPSWIDREGYSKTIEEIQRVSITLDIFRHHHRIAIFIVTFFVCC